MGVLGGQKYFLILGVYLALETMNLVHCHHNLAHKTLNLVFDGINLTFDGEISHVYVISGLSGP